MGFQKVRSFFDQLEETLETQARVAGLLEHGASIGAVREFFVQEVLKNTLPPSAHIGSGRVIGATDDRVSRQVDVVVYDPRFPVLSFGAGVSLYLIEGVIATIEVKSQLTKRTLTEAMENCYSVMEIGAHAQEEDLNRRVMETIGSLKCSKEAAQERLKGMLRPSTYVFAFRGYSHNLRNLVQAVDDWYAKHGQPGSVWSPEVPSVIAGQGTVCVSQGDITSVYAGEEDRAAIRHKYGEHAEPIAVLFKSKHRFGVLVSHLLLRVTSRLGAGHAGAGVRYGPEKYLELVVDSYMKEHVVDKSVEYLIRT